MLLPGPVAWWRLPDLQGDWRDSLSGVPMNWPSAFALVGCALAFFAFFAYAYRCATREGPARHNETADRIKAGYRPAEPTGWEVDPIAAAKGKVGPFPVKTGCPVPNCRIRSPHSHTEALIRRMRGE